MLSCVYSPTDPTEPHYNIVTRSGFKSRHYVKAKSPLLSQYKK